MIKLIKRPVNFEFKKFRDKETDEIREIYIYEDNSDKLSISIKFKREIIGDNYYNFLEHKLKNWPILKIEKFRLWDVLLNDDSKDIVVHVLDEKDRRWLNEHFEKINDDNILKYC